MKNITIQILGVGFCDEVKVSIWNSQHECIFDGKTNFGKISVALDTKNIYLLSVNSHRGYFQIPFYVDCKRDCYYFEWPMRRPIERIITFQLTDANYMNLPIEKGEIIVE